MLKEFLCGEYFRKVYLCSAAQRNPEAVQLSLVFKVAIHRRLWLHLTSPNPEGFPIFLLIFEYNKYFFSRFFLEEIVSNSIILFYDLADKSSHNKLLQISQSAL